VHGDDHGDDEISDLHDDDNDFKTDTNCNYIMHHQRYYYSPSKMAEGPYYLGTFSIVDIGINSLIDRFSVTIKYYRDFDILTEIPNIEKIVSSFQACKSRPAFQGINFFVPNNFLYSLIILIIIIIIIIHSHHFTPLEICSYDSNPRILLLGS
jgi:hypothetical protein